MNSILRSKIIGAFCNSGQNIKGVEHGCTTLIDLLHETDYKFDNSTVHSFITSFDDKNIKKNGYNVLNKKSEEIYKTGQRLCILGGDHSISSASIPAFLDLYKENAHILWIDAHADINTIASSPSGNSHGMCLAKIFKLEENIVSSKYVPSFDQLTYLGLRSSEEYENKLIENHNIKNYSSEQANSDKIIPKLINRLKNKNLYISLDVDALDQEYIPCTGTPVSNGIKIDNLCEILLQLDNNCNINAFDLVEFNPILHKSNEKSKSLENIEKILRILL